MQAYRHILLATDFSEFSEPAAQRAAELAQRYGADLTLIHILEHFPEDIPIDSIAPEDIDPRKFLTDRAHLELKELAARNGWEKANREFLVSMRSAKAEIVRFAGQNQVDLIVLGSHGRQGIQGLPGSTANGVINAASCDVLAVRAPQ